MTASSTNLAAFADRMRVAGLPELAIRTFGYYYAQLTEGETGLIPEAAIEPVAELTDAVALETKSLRSGAAALSHTVVIKLNGGLGTGMGLDRAKSLITLKAGLSFLDIAVRQARDNDVPLVLMNSFRTRKDSLELLGRYPGLRSDLPHDFLQHRIPKVACTDLLPVAYPDAPELEWCPPGHGDLYAALVSSGMLDAMLEAGYEYAFVSNADNLGAVLDPLILGHMVDERLPFLMEVADRTPADRKGGHLASRHDGRLLLRESAQCPAEDTAAFQDVSLHRYFNTNNLWIRLRSLRELILARDGILGLPMIRNRKTVDPRDPDSPEVYQLETAMGSAIELFDRSGAIRVPRSRFAPVKTTDDLLAVRSDAYLLRDDYQIVPEPRRENRPLLVQLDPDYYRLLDAFEARFPSGPPSLVDCDELIVRGEFVFGRGVRATGRVQLRNDSVEPVSLADGTVLRGS